MYTTTKPPLFVSKRFLREQNHELQQQLAHAQNDVVRMRSRLAVAEEQASQWETAARNWMGKYKETEQSVDLQAARDEGYQSGIAWQRRLFRSWLLGQADAIEWEKTAE